MEKMKSQLRQDLVSGDWIVIAPGRARRPHQFWQKKEKRKIEPKSTCPFEDPEKQGNRPILSYGMGSWDVMLIENKYPAFVHQRTCSAIVKDGPYSVTGTGGHHELLITRDHRKNFSDISKTQASQVLEAFRDRYLMLVNDRCIQYISLFQNWGASAGASIYHPHYQLIATPIVPPDITHSLRGSDEYYQKHRQCVHCLMISWEQKHRRRIIYENAGAIVFAPFVSRAAFEMRVFPKNHTPYFENTLDTEMDFVADALRQSLKQLKKNLHDPDYNFFIHTAPLKNKEAHRMYHWHIEVIPKISKPAGFELGTGIDINAVDPDDAARILRK